MDAQTEARQVARKPERVLIIVPAYNEARALRPLLFSLRAQYAAWDVVVIDDGSTDATREAASGLARIVSLPCNLGIGGAVQTGLQIALREDYDLAVQVDGDGQHPSEEIPKLLRGLRDSGCDLVVGSRFRMDGGAKSTAARRVGIRLFSSVLSLLCGTQITDATSGFRMMNRRAIEVLSREYSEDYPEVEALLVAHRAGLHIAEVPVQMLERKTGKSSVGGLKSIFYMAKVSLAILMTLLRDSTA